MNRPLDGRKILITRAAGQAEGFSLILRGAGADVIEVPTIETVAPVSWDALDRGIERIASYDFIIFTSVNGVDFFMKRLTALGLSISDIAGARVITVGPKTAARLIKYGGSPEPLPDEFKQEGVAASLAKEDISGKRFLYPRAEVAREVLPEKLREMGAVVDIAVAYRTVAPYIETEAVDRIFAGGISAVTFTSSSTVKNFMVMVGEQRAKAFLGGVCIACIGPVTASTCQELGLHVSVVPKDYTVDALLISLTEYFKGEIR